MHYIVIMPFIVIVVYACVHNLLVFHARFAVLVGLHKYNNIIHYMYYVTIVEKKYATLGTPKPVKKEKCTRGNQPKRHHNLKEES